MPLTDGDGVDAPPPADHPPQPRCLQSLPAEVVGGHVVEDRIQARVEGDERHGNPPRIVDGIAGGAVLNDVHALQEVQQVDHVVGQEAEHRDGQDGTYDLDGLLGRFGLKP